MCIEGVLGYIMVRRDGDEYFLSCGYDTSKLTVLYLSFKWVLPNIFQSTCFKRHQQLLTNGRDDSSKLSNYLQSTTD